MVYLLTFWYRYGIVYISGEDTVSNLAEVNKDVSDGQCCGQRYSVQGR
nr:MAG TPA: hypothetical protein [Caudoviricetes sp.]